MAALTGKLNMLMDSKIRRYMLVSFNSVVKAIQEDAPRVIEKVDQSQTTAIRFAARQ